MHKLLASIAAIGCLVGATSLVPSQVAAKEPIVSFYCGQSFDPSSNRIVPTTLVASSSAKDPIALIQWKSTAFGKYTPQNRCNSVSSKMKQAWDAKRLKYLIAGTSKRTGQGMICGVKDPQAGCNESSMLFTLTNGADAKEIIDRLKTIKRGTSSNPVAQSSGGDAIDLQGLIE